MAAILDFWTPLTNFLKFPTTYICSPYLSEKNEVSHDYIEQKIEIFISYPMSVEGLSRHLGFCEKLQGVKKIFALK